MINETTLTIESFKHIEHTVVNGVHYRVCRPYCDPKFVVLLTLRRTLEEEYKADVSYAIKVHKGEINPLAFPDTTPQDPNEERDNEWANAHCFTAVGPDHSVDQ